MTVIKAGAIRNIRKPSMADAMRIRMTATEKMLSASFFLPCPRLMEIGTDDPTPIRSATAKLMMTKGIARLIAAKAVLPSP